MLWSVAMIVLYVEQGVNLMSQSLLGPKIWQINLKFVKNKKNCFAVRMKWMGEVKIKIEWWSDDNVKKVKSKI